MTNAALRGKPDAGNPHVRFDEGEVAPAATPRRRSLLYNIKSVLCVAVSALAAMLNASDTPEVSNVQMSQQTMGRKVTITYELNNAPNGAVITFDVETNRTGTVTSDDADWVSIGGAAVCNAKGDVWKKVSQGSRTITWRPDLSWEGHKISLDKGGARAVVTAWALDNTPDYMVVDISAGAQPNTQKYYPSVDFLPGGILGNDDYRTTKLVMRKIMAKDVEWTMGSTTLETERNAARETTHQAKLESNYYIGVFPITQSQWGLIQTSRPAPSYFNNLSYRAMRPVEQVCYNEIRNAANDTAENAAYNWPNDPNPSSFLGLLHSRTGIAFDLPSEAQWEFAARAGNGATKWGDGSSIQNQNPDANLNLLGRYTANGGGTNPAASIDATTGTAIVGTYKPNAWGLYDTAGNVWELCLDWYADDITAHGGKVNIDPATPANTLSGASGASRVFRGGAWYSAAGNCRPAYRGSTTPSTRADSISFRVLCSAGLR